MSPARVIFLAVLAPLALGVATSSCEIIAGIRNLTPADGGAGGSPGTGGVIVGAGAGGVHDAGSGGAGGAGKGGSAGTVDAGSAGAGVGGMGMGGTGVGGTAAGGMGMGGHAGTGGTGSGATGSGGMGSGGMTGSGGKIGTGGMGIGGTLGVGGRNGTGGTCVTSFAGGKLIWGFDAAQGASDWLVSDVPAAPGETEAYTALDGNQCFGSLVFTAPFTGYSQTFNMVGTTKQDFTGRTLLHLSIKVAPEVGVPAMYSALSGVVVEIGSGGLTVFSVQFFTIDTFLDGGWHDVIVDLRNLTPAPVLSTIGEIVVSLAAPQTQPSGAPASPGAWAMFVDDIWVE